ncbi:MAG: hypothetical protein OFPII_38450 [Osedax symbiont Rs1]|nr:MAG: hypothetical protein OFPII_38450 [Osedax symbiont Rs1]
MRKLKLKQLKALLNCTESPNHNNAGQSAKKSPHLAGISNGRIDCYCL